MTDTRQLKIKIGQILAEKRLQKGLSYRKIEIETGLTQTQVKSIENGSNNYTSDSLVLLDLALDANIFNKIIYTE